MTTGANSPLAALPFETDATGRSKGGRTKATSQAFLQAFPNLGCFRPSFFRPSFSKQIFGRFVGFQGVASIKNLNDVPPNFLWLPPPFSRNPDADAPHFPVSPAPHAFERARRFA